MAANERSEGTVGGQSHSISKKGVSGNVVVIALRVGVKVKKENEMGDRMTQIRI